MKLTLTRSKVTETIIQLALAKDIDEILTYAEVSAAIGRDIHGCRHFLSSALRVARNQHGREWKSEPNVGYRLLDYKERLNATGTVLRKINTGRRRGQRILANTPDDKLDSEHRIVKMAYGLRLSAIGVFGGHSGEQAATALAMVQGPNLPKRKDLIKIFG